MTNKGACHAVFAAVAVVFLWAAAAGASAPIRVYENPAVFGGLKVRPGMLTLAADGNYTITGLRWTGWGSSTARARGVNHVDNCLPNCANGHIARVRVLVRLFSRGKYVYRCYAIKPAAVGYLRRLCLT